MTLTGGVRTIPFPSALDGVVAQADGTPLRPEHREGPRGEAPKEIESVMVDEDLKDEVSETGTANLTQVDLKADSSAERKRLTTFRYGELYWKAAQQFPGVPWEVLAAIHFKEASWSGDGCLLSRADGVSLGPMQFNQATFARYATDGNGDGRTSICSLADSVFTTAAMLWVNGMGVGDIAGALASYNSGNRKYPAVVLSLARNYGCSIC